MLSPIQNFFWRNLLRNCRKKKSVDKITVKEIVKNCGLTPPTFYNHFCDKYDLIAWIYSKPIEEIVNRIDNDSYKLKNSIADIVKYFSANKDFLKNLILNTSGQTSFINYVAQAHIKILSNYIKRTQKVKNLPQDTELFVKLYCYGTVCTLCEFLLKPFPISDDELVKIFVDALPAQLQKYFYKSPKK